MYSKTLKSPQYSVEILQLELANPGFFLASETLENMFLTCQHLLVKSQYLALSTPANAFIKLCFLHALLNLSAQELEGREEIHVIFFPLNVSSNSFLKLNLYLSYCAFADYLVSLVFLLKSTFVNKTLLYYYCLKQERIYFMMTLG